MKSLCFNLVFVSILGLNLAGAEEEVESYHQSIARYFVDRMKFSGGRVLDQLKLGRLISKKGEVRIRISSALPSRQMSSVEIELLEGAIYITRTTNINSKITSRTINVDGEDEVVKELRTIIQGIEVRNKFWDSLSLEEEGYFTSLLDGGVVLFEIADSETYRSVALCGLDFTAPADVDFLRNLDPYRKLLQLLNEL